MISGTSLWISVNQKIVVFSKSRQPEYVFTFNSLLADIVKGFNYHGAMFSKKVIHVKDIK